MAFPANSPHDGSAGLTFWVWMCVCVWRQTHWTVYGPEAQRCGCAGQFQPLINTVGAKCQSAWRKEWRMGSASGSDAGKPLRTSSHVKPRVLSRFDDDRLCFTFWRGLVVVSKQTNRLCTQWGNLTLFTSFLRTAGLIMEVKGAEPSVEEFIGRYRRYVDPGVLVLDV